MIAGLLWMLVANAATLLGAHALLETIRTGKTSLDLVLLLLIRLTLVTAAVIIAGMAGVLTPAGLGLPAALALAGLAASGTHRSLLRRCGLRLRGWRTIVAALVVLQLLLQVWFLSPFVGDALSYHLPKIGEWVSHGGFTRELGADPRVTFPAGFEAVETWWVVFLHHDVLIEMAGVEFLALAAAATSALAKSVDLSDRAAFLAAILVALTPGFHLQAVGCLNDGPAAALILATAALVAARLPVALPLLAVGLGAGVKPTCLFALPGIGLLWLLVRREPATAVRSRPAALGLATLALAAGSFWYARNAVYYGSPIYPLGTRAAVFASGVPFRLPTGPSLRSLADNLGSLVNSSVYDRTQSYGAMMASSAGWGAVTFGCGFVALLTALRKDAPLRRLGAAFGLSLLSILALVRPDFWFARFALFFSALFALAIARLSESLRGLAPLVATLLLVQGAATVVPSELPEHGLRDLVMQGWRERTRGPIVPSEPEEGAVACLVPGGHWAYLLYRPDFSRRVVYVHPKSGDELAGTMKRENLPVLYASVFSRPLAQLLLRGELTPTGGAFYLLKH